MAAQVEGEAGDLAPGEARHGRRIAAAMFGHAVHDEQCGARIGRNEILSREIGAVVARHEAASSQMPARISCVNAAARLAGDFSRPASRWLPRSRTSSSAPWMKLDL